MELPSTGDLVFITKTAVQFVTTKGVHLQDYAHYPYCLAHPAILCPSGHYGSVNGVCIPCSSATDELASVAEQMQCVPVAGSEVSCTQS